MTLGAPASRRPGSEEGKRGEEQAGETPALPVHSADGSARRISVVGTAFVGNSLGSPGIPRTGWGRRRFGFASGESARVPHWPFSSSKVSKPWPSTLSFLIERIPRREMVGVNRPPEESETTT